MQTAAWKKPKSKAQHSAWELVCSFFLSLDTVYIVFSVPIVSIILNKDNSNINFFVRFVFLNVQLKYNATEANGLCFSELVLEDSQKYFIDPGDQILVQ